MSDFGPTLRSWRDRLGPADAGLPVSARRRTPGLRREELAQLAGISVDYLTRLEQGRVTAPSSQVLEALSRALRLSAGEREHLFALGRRVPRQDRMRTELTPSVTRLMEQLNTPVVVHDALWNRLAWNRPFAAMFGDPSGRRGIHTNLVWSYLTNQPNRAIRPPEEGRRYLRAYVADLRRTQARFPDDPRVGRLIAELHRTGTEFTELWERHDAEAVHQTEKAMHHPRFGRVDLDCDILTVDGADLRVLLFTAAPGSPAADAIALLASIEMEAVPQASD